MQNLEPYIRNKDHVIWDWNGTLLNDLDLAVASTNHLLKQENLPPMSAEKYKKIFRFPVIDYYRDLGLDTNPEKFLELCRQFNHLFHEGLKNASLWSWTADTLKKIKEMGKTQSILSASEQNLLNQSVKLFEIEQYFDHVMGIADYTAASKVERGRELMKIAAIEQSKCILIGDTDHDLEVANVLGIDAILVDHGHQHADLLRAKHHTVIKIF